VNAVDAGSGGQADPGDATAAVAVLGGAGVIALGAGWVLTLHRRGAHL